jgi:hypothetical protein
MDFRPSIWGGSDPASLHRQLEADMARQRRYGFLKKKSLLQPIFEKGDKQ